MRQAVGTHLLGRVWLSVAQLITIALVAKKLTEAEQGYYYSFLSFQSIENLFELGFRLVVLQFASHEAAHLVWTDDRRLVGPEPERRRLGLLVRFSLKFYLGLALTYGILVFGAGVAYFGFFQETVGVAWQVPWAWMMMASAFLLFTAPFNMLLEGCGRVDESYRLRLFMGIGASLAVWGVLLANGKLFATGSYVFGSAAIAFAWIAIRYRRFFLEIIREPLPEDHREFIKSFWRMQNKVAASSVAYFLRTPILALVAFPILGEKIAGQLGMAVSMVTLILTAGSAWIITSATRMGNLVAQRNYEQLDRELRSTMKRALYTSVVATVGALVLVGILKAMGSSIGGRILPMPDLVLLAVGTLFQVIALAYTYYSRAFKREPLMAMNLVVGVLSVAFAVAGAYWMGSLGITLGYAALSVLSAWWAKRVIDAQRDGWRLAPDSDEPPVK